MVAGQALVQLCSVVIVAQVVPLWDSHITAADLAVVAIMADPVLVMAVVQASRAAAARAADMLMLHGPVLTLLA
jgi:ketosteroid isomerase-like protein